MARSRLILLGLVAVGLVTAGCGGSGGVSSGNDLAQGRAVFNDPSVGCGNCHTLAAAGSSGQVGPNLDDSFGAARAQGFDPSTFEQVVREQIRIPGIGSQMPANLVDGEEADNVAYFIATCAGNPDAQECQAGSGGGITAMDGPGIFAAAGCGSCHTFTPGGGKGNVGPNLDEAMPSVELVIDRVTNGMGAMPSFSNKLSEEQIKTLAEWIASGGG